MLMCGCDTPHGPSDVADTKPVRHPEMCPHWCGAVVLIILLARHLIFRCNLIALLVVTTIDGFAITAIACALASTCHARLLSSRAEVES